VISGMAEVMKDDKILIIPPLQSVEIPAGCKHTVYNSMQEDLHIIEVQTGSYFGEDDIIRIDDMYGRA
jgi:mannose-6-phosphate isomerase-like protein (cupin superfamily)